MPSHWTGPSFLVAVPKDASPFYRLLTSAEHTPDDFRPDSETRERFYTEDHATYRGFSAWERLEQAFETARLLNEHREAADKGEPPITHVVEFSIRYKKRHACSFVGPLDGHHVIWARAEELRPGEVWPIEE